MTLRPSSCSLCPARSGAGFTLFELLVVLALIGLISALALPRLSGSYGRLPLRTAARDLAAILRHARSQAVARGQALAVVYQPGENRVVISAAASPMASEVDGAERRVFLLPDGIFIENQDARDLDQTEEVAIATFFPIGNSTGAAVSINDAAGHSQRIDVEMITGAVTLNQDESSF